MGVERQGAKVNWITSFALIVMAGTFYRMRNFLQNMSKYQIKDLREKAGQIYHAHQQVPSILPLKTKPGTGEWESVLQHRQQYKLLHRLYTWSEGSFRRKY